jgi:hypothetical protein
MPPCHALPDRCQQLAWTFAAFASTFAALAALGCGRSSQPSLGLVHGTVTLDGSALANATVLFTPDGRGRTSQGITDTKGRYELRYLRDIRGADVDHHTVKITTACEEHGGRERLPPRYHARTQLEARVAVGTNTFDFDLRSGGP